MNKTSFLTVFVMIGCVITLIISYLVYDSRLDSVATHADSSAIQKEENDGNASEKVPSETSSKTTESEKLTSEQIDSLTENMSEDVRVLVTSRLKAGEKIQLLIIGSSFINEGNPGYGNLLTTSLSQSYGEWIEPTTKSFDGTTANLVNELDNNFIDWSKEYDIVLMEGMNLSNNGEVIVEDSVEHIELINEQLKSYVNDGVLIVHPSQPLASAIYYPVEVDSFKTYMTDRGYTYIDHWTEWPIGNKEEMNTYLTEDSSPNKEGAALWASALSTFFTGK
ncbi:SGNH/GDSL hydrolase family protein [Paenisporosarcina quisquiliarum]|uniref:SGNH/GDSL hydrolase family protein n=1 Tax=Paenisporosarcina quisquiliarum TaxID=365346 RepID=A0A9X3REC1_9BACL|nr:SGNH/GDSL hydrolase family protein [Paenisporosarcina quisquiliarum]MCZ8537243.1 SGNH/GDSL hydrolase family protein [Paenisporosarcina quisquiliarum]